MIDDEVVREIHHAMARIADQPAKTMSEYETRARRLSALMRAGHALEYPDNKGAGRAACFGFIAGAVLGFICGVAWLWFWML